MTPLPAALGGAGLVGWRLDRDVFAPTWDSGIGAERVGGRWNTRGKPTVYATLDPSTAILEVAVHAGFNALDTVPYTLTSFEIADPSSVHILKSEDIPNPAWLQSGIASIGQQRFGDDLLSKHPFVVLPSAVSRQSWNLIFNPTKAAGLYSLSNQDVFVLDTRLNPVVS